MPNFEIKSVADYSTLHSTWLLWGKWGSGKTTLAATAPKPILFLNFDAVGLQSIARMEGVEYIDFLEGIGNPNAYNLFDSFLTAQLGAVRDKYATIVLDSMTGLQEAVMNEQLFLSGKWGQKTEDVYNKKTKEKVKRIGGVPHQDDYLPVMGAMANVITKLTKALIGKNVIFTAHEEAIFDEEEPGRKVVVDHLPLIVGKLKDRIGIWFSEIYNVRMTVIGGKKLVKVLTAPEGLYNASTRLGAGGVFNTWEVPDLSVLLEKAAKARKQHNNGAKDGVQKLNASSATKGVSNGKAK